MFRHTHTHTRGLTGESQRRGEERMVTASTLVSLSVSSEDRGAEPSDRTDPLSSETSTLVTQDTLLSSCMCCKLLSSSIFFSPIKNLAKVQHFQHVSNGQKTQMQTLILNVIKKSPFDIYVSRHLSCLLMKHAREMKHTAPRVDAKN